VVGDVIYIFGGRGVDGKDLGDLAAFNMSSQRWFIFQNMVVAPSGRSGHAMASVGTRVFVLGGESFTPTKSDDHGIINILETRHIKYPDLRNGNGLPANEVDRDLSVIPTLLPGEVTPGSPVNDVINTVLELVHRIMPVRNHVPIPKIKHRHALEEMIGMYSERTTGIGRKSVLPSTLISLPEITHYLQSRPEHRHICHKISLMNSREGHAIR
jgi:hypothetical protein